ncbi:MAG: phospho-sugar mutase [Thermogutta sp.]|nr:phospho-sugar mutase [Thermogutta sp.]
MDWGEPLTALSEAEKRGEISSSAAENIRAWLTEPYYAAYAPQVAEMIEARRWRELNDLFWQVIPFGTGGRRGRMFPVGTNAINDRTIGESAQGVADYVKRIKPGKSLSCGIAYDTRHRSRHFAELCAGIMAANGFTVHFLDEYRSTPEMSFLIRYKRCDCGIMVTASHNPPSDNAVKVYWSTGGQVLPPHDRGMIECVKQVQEIRAMPFTEASAKGLVVPCTEEVDAAYRAALARQSRPGPRDLRVLYSPLHGVGSTAVLPGLEAAGFEQVEVFGPHAEPNGDFPNVVDHVANPENPRVFDAMIDEARRRGFDLVLATDPDADRLGCAAPVTPGADASWTTLTGNQIASLLADYLLSRSRAEATLTPRHYVVETLVTTRLIGRIARAYGVRCIDDLMVGFKWIGGTMEYEGPEWFLLGVEESYGYLVGDHARDKDGAVAAIILCELAAQLKQRGMTLPMQLEELFRRYGVHAERAFSVAMPGAEGMTKMAALMSKFRAAPPDRLGGLDVTRTHDLRRAIGDYEDDLELAMAAARSGDVVILDLAGSGNRVAVRPSGTEPKCKFYMFAAEPPNPTADVAAVRDALNARLEAVEADLRAYASRV